MSELDMRYDRHRVRRRIDAALDGEDYSVTEMAHDLERLATHPVWEQSERVANEAESAYEQGVSDAVKWLRAAADRCTDNYARTLLNGNAHGLAAAFGQSQGGPDA